MTSNTFFRDGSLRSVRDIIHNSVRRALCDAETADHAFIKVNLREVIFYYSGVIGADFGTDAARNTACLAVLLGGNALIL